MATTLTERDATTRSTNPKETEEALVELEYHALMGVDGGDIPTHVRAFDRDVFGPLVHPAHVKMGEMVKDHEARM